MRCCRMNRLFPLIMVMVGCLDTRTLLSKKGGVASTNKVDDKAKKKYNEELIRGSAQGKKKIVRRAIKKGADDYDWAMQLAARRGHLEIVEILLEKGAGNLNIVMEEAAQEGHIEVVELLCDKGAGEYNYVMTIAAQEGLVEIVKLMLERGADEYYHSMYAATGRDHREIQIALLSTFTNRIDDQYLLSDEAKRSLLIIKENLKYPVSRYGFEKEFLESKIDEGAIGKEGSFPIYLPNEITAKIFSYVDLSSILELILLYSKRDFKEDILKDIDENEWNEYMPINYRDGNGLTMLHKLCYYGHKNKVNFLLKKGALKNMVDIKGRRPLFYAKLGGEDGGYSKNSKFLEWLEKLESMGLK